MSAPTVDIHKYISRTEVEGPGKRFSIWLQGCSIRCKGCQAKDTWDAGEGTPMVVDDLFRMITATERIEGVTILGGEPLDQPEALLTLLRKIRSTTFLSVLLFTGYEMDSLTDSLQKEIISLCDIVVDGPYREGLQDFSRAMIGSSNQRIHFITGRYTQENWDNLPHSIEIRIGENGEVTLNGLWKKEWMEDFLQNL